MIEASIVKVFSRTLDVRAGGRGDSGYLEERIWQVKSLLDLLYLSGLIIIQSQDLDRREQMRLKDENMTCLRKVLAGG